MDLYEKEVSELLNFFRRASTEKEKGLGKSFCIQAVHLPSYKEEEFNAEKNRLIGIIGRQISILDILVKRNNARVTQLGRILDLKARQMELFLTNFMREMNEPNFRDNQFRLCSNKNYERLRSDAERFFRTLTRMRRMGTVENSKVPEELKESLRLFLTEEYGKDRVDKVCAAMKELILNQSHEIDAIRPLGDLVRYMINNEIGQLRGVPESERSFVEENVRICGSLLRSIRREESLGAKFKALIRGCFDRTMIVERIAEINSAANPREGPNNGLTQGEIDAMLS